MGKVTFPKIGQKHGFKPLFGAKEDVRPGIRIPKKVLFIYSTGGLQRKLREVMKLKSCDKHIGSGGAWPGQNFITSDRKMLVVALPLGGPITAIAVDQAAFLGAKEFLIVGAAGGIGRSLSIADVVVCDKAIRDEGTSHHYVANSKYSFPNSRFTRRLELGMRKAGVEYFKGATWTTDAPFAETKYEIRRYRGEGVLTVEMEAATLFAVAKKRGVEAAAVFTISDILGAKWSGFQDKIYQKYGYERLSLVAKTFKDM